MDKSERIIPGVWCGRDDWITKLLNEVVKSIDDSDEVIVDDSNCVDGEKDVDDDDCVILDGDPDKLLAIENDVDNDSDDLYLVGEKVEVACRDFPHPRHLCVNFPFNSTPHKKHCDKCHCYVCDSVAPCVYWGNGVSSIDHCHAIEKDEFWDARREEAKTSYRATPFVPEVGLVSTNQVPLLPGNPLMRTEELPLSQPITCSGTPYGVIPMTAQESGCDPSEKSQSHLIPRHLWRQSVGHAHPQFNSQRVPLERPQLFGGILTTVKYLNSSQNNLGNQFSWDQSLESRLEDTGEEEI